MCTGPVLIPEGTQVIRCTVSVILNICKILRHCYKTYGCINCSRFMALRQFWAQINLSWLSDSPRDSINVSLSIEYTVWIVCPLGLRTDTLNIWNRPDTRFQPHAIRHVTTYIVSHGVKSPSSFIWSQGLRQINTGCYNVAMEYLVMLQWHIRVTAED